MLPPDLQPIRILSADRSDLLRLGARLTIEQHPDCQVLAEAGDFITLLKLAASEQPDVILVGEGLDAALTLKQQVNALQVAAAQARLVVLCSPVTAGWFRNSWRRGWPGWWTKLMSSTTRTNCYVPYLR